MAINKKLVHFKTFAKFNEELSAGNILDTSICWIKDTKQIWTHGQFYDCSSLTDEDIVGTALVGYTESVETNENLDLTAEDTIVGAFGKLVKAIKDNEEVDSAAFVKLRDSVGLDENLGFSTSAGDSNVTEAIERIDGKIISTGDGTKFLADNGRYLTAGGAVNITEIFKRIEELATTGTGTCTEEDYNILKRYADNGVTTYANMDGASMQVNILYMDSMILIRFDIFDGEQNNAQQIQITSNRTVNYIYNSFLGASVAGGGLLGSYTKPSAYSAITKNNSISTAIGKLEANVEKITTSGDGTKFLADDGTYKIAGSQYLDLSIFPEESGTLSNEDYQKVVNAYNNKISSAYFPNEMVLPASISSTGNGDFIILCYLLNSTSGQTSISIYTFNILADKSYSYSTSLINFFTKNDGTKFLADDGQYKKIGTPIEAVVSSTGTITQKLSPNKYYKFGRCTSLTIALGAEVSGILNEYMFEFLSGATATVLNLPETVKWNNGNAPTIDANKKYIVSIVSNIAVIGGV